MLDEPTNGLDPQGTREVRNLVRSLAADGATVFVSSHLLAEVEQICTHAAIMSAGRLVAQGTLAELRQAGQARIRVLTPDPGTAAQVLAGLGLVSLPTSADNPAGTPARTAGRPLAAGPAGGSTGEGVVLFAPLPGFGAAGGTADGVPAPEAVVAALVAAGVRVRGFRDRAGQPGGPLCGVDGGGVRRCPVRHPRTGIPAGVTPASAGPPGG